MCREAEMAPSVKCIWANIDHDYERLRENHIQLCMCFREAKIRNMSSILQTRHGWIYRFAKYVVLTLSHRVDDRVVVW